MKVEGEKPKSSNFVKALLQNEQTLRSIESQRRFKQVTQESSQ